MALIKDHTIVRSELKNGIFQVFVKYNISFNWSAEMNYIIAFTQPVIIRAILEVAGYLPSDYKIE